jgi:hypothetical protein
MTRAFGLDPPLDDSFLPLLSVLLKPLLVDHLQIGLFRLLLLLLLLLDNPEPFRSPANLLIFDCLKRVEDRDRYFYKAGEERRCFGGLVCCFLRKGRIPEKDPRDSRPPRSVGV